MLLSPINPSRKDARQFNNGPPFDPVGTVLFTHPANYPSTCGMPIQQFTQVRVHFAGPAMRYIHGGRSIVPIDPRILDRVNFSWIAHARRFREHGQNPELPPPPANIMEGIVIDLTYVDMWVRTNAVVNKMMFMIFVEFLTPATVTGSVEHGLLQWDIVCPECGEAIAHHCFDESWNGRYLEHRRSPQCKKQEIRPVVKQAEASSKVPRRGGQGSRL